MAGERVVDICDRINRRDLDSLGNLIYSGLLKAESGDPLTPEEEAGWVGERRKIFIKAKPRITTGDAAEMELLLKFRKLSCGDKFNILSRIRSVLDQHKTNKQDGFEGGKNA